MAVLPFHGEEWRDGEGSQPSMLTLQPWGKGPNVEQIRLLRIQYLGTLYLTSCILRSYEKILILRAYSLLESAYLTMKKWKKLIIAMSQAHKGLLATSSPKTFLRSTLICSLPSNWCAGGHLSALHVSQCALPPWGGGP